MSRKGYPLWFRHLIIMVLITLLATSHLGIAARFLHLPFLPVSIRAEQLATGHDILVFRAGFPRTIYSLDLESGQLKHIISDAGLMLSVSPDGRMVAFNSENNLYVVNVDGTGLRQITDGERRITSLSWSPDGHRLAYVITVPPSTRDSDLHVWNLDTLEDKRLNPDELSVDEYSSIHWLPDGHGLLFRARKRQPGFEKDWYGESADSVHFDLYLINDDGSNLVNLTNGIGNVIASYLSPDGQTVIFSSDMENRAATEKEGDYMHDFKVFLMNLETREMVEVMSLLTGRQEAPLGWPSSPWAPDSEWVLLPPRILRPDTLRAVKPDGTLHHEIINLTYGPRGDVGISGFTVSLSPDGKTVAGGGRFKEGGKECLCAVDADGSDFRVLVPDVYVKWLVWSPDSKSIFFMYIVEEFSTDYQYGIVNVDGSGFYDPFAGLPEKLTRVEDVHWVRLSLPTPTPTVLTPAATPVPTSTPGGGICATSGAIVVAAVLAWWVIQQRR